MIVANTSIVIGKKEYREGQAVTGLSALDKRWMLAAGYILESKDAVEGDSRGRQKQKSATESSEDTASGNEK